MNILSVENLSKAYLDKILFDSISFGIDEKDKIGLIGINGTGKSTLLKILAGREEPDSGTVTRNKNVSIQYLSQNLDFEDEATVLEQIFRGDNPVISLIKEYEYLSEALAKNPEKEALQKSLLALNPKMDALGAWRMESEAKIILTKLGITDFDAKIRSLSGGQKKRIALAEALIQPAELLILDEPTNHIDNDAVEWLEEYLKKRKGALLMITHDRYFLDRVSNRSIELDDGRLYSYEGNYSVFVEKKNEREQELIRLEKKRLNLFRRELDWIRAGAKARSTKQKARIQRFEELKEEKFERPSETIEISVGVRRLGKKVIHVKNVSKSFDNKVLIRDFEYIVLPDDRVGIIGPNGSGKSTLLNIIAGKIKLDNGIVEIGDTVKIGYYSQENEEMNEALRVIDYIKEEADFIETADGAKITASQMLERFLFTSKMQYTPIQKLSGGERRRLYLLRVLMSAPNVLILDEPTNDLDIHTLTVLEEYIDYFKGAVIVVSHDRCFLDKVVDKIFSFEGNGEIKQYTGVYSDFYDQVKAKREALEKAKPEATVKTDKPAREKEPVLKFSFKESKEYEEIDSKIEAVEEEVKKIGREIGGAGSNYVLLQELTEKQRQLESRLHELMNRWEYLNELAEKIQNQQK